MTLIAILLILILWGVWAIERTLKKLAAELNGQKGGDSNG